MIACPECGDVFRRPSRLDQHLAEHARWREPEPSPFELARRVLLGRRWTEDEAAALILLINQGAARLSSGTGSA